MKKFQDYLKLNCRLKGKLLRGKSKKNFSQFY
jgi:hypothetical protein